MQKKFEFGLNGARPPRRVVAFLDAFRSMNRALDIEVANSPCSFVPSPQTTNKMHAILSVVLLASTVSAWGLKHRSNHQQWSVDHPQPVEWSDWDEQWYAAHPEDDLISEPLTRRQVDLTGPNFPVNVTQLEYEVVRNARCATPPLSLFFAVRPGRVVDLLIPLIFRIFL